MPPKGGVADLSLEELADRALTFAVGGVGGAEERVEGTAQRVEDGVHG